MPAQPNGRAAWPSGDDNGGFFLIVSAIGCCILAVLLWMRAHGPISGGVMALFHTEIVALRHLTDRFDLADRQMAAANPENVGLRDLYGIAHAVGGAVRVPAALFILLLGFVCMARAAPSRFKRRFDLDGLVREQARSFPTTAAFATRHLGLVPPSRAPRPADYALTPEEWIAGHASRSNGTFDEAAARRGLVSQLGPRWHGVEEAAPHARALFAVFALHLAERRAEALGLLGALSASLAAVAGDPPDGPDASLQLPEATVARADAVRADLMLCGPAARIAARHAYVATALMALLNASRLEAGVLAPGQFVWLKLVDRPLWYALHSLGFEMEGFGRTLHPNPRVEAAGARDHWAAECIAGGPLAQPDIDRAVEAVRKLAASRSPKTADRS